MTKTSPVNVSVVSIAVILAIAALQASKPLTLPLAFAILIAVLVSPLQQYLERRFPRWLSLALVLALLVAVFGAFLGIIEISLELIEPKVPEYTERGRELLQALQQWINSYGFSISLEPGSSGAGQVARPTLRGLRTLLSVLSLVVLVTSMLLLLLMEVRQYPGRLKRAFPEGVGEKLINATSAISYKLRQFLYVMAFTSLLTGLLTWGWCAILGVELSLVWGLLAFALNFIPTIGSLIAVVPPTIIALAFNGPSIAIATLMGLATMQAIMGNIVDPRLQGDSLQLSSFVALVSIVFWGWVWGIPGAFIGVPMTAAIVVICSQFKATRGVAILLGGIDGKEGSKQASAQREGEASTS
ncbi:MAG: AI-2E family transporter [Cyanobacteria bacterium P01_A01_bin.135]